MKSKKQLLVDAVTHRLDYERAFLAVERDELSEVQVAIHEAVIENLSVLAEICQKSFGAGVGTLHALKEKLDEMPYDVRTSVSMKLCLSALLSEARIYEQLND